MRKLLFITLSLFVLACQPPAKYDLIIKGGTIYDGSGLAPIMSDLGINGDKIEAIGDLSKAEAPHIIDASGLAVSPGFIDLHTHLNTLLRLPGAESHIRQGVTTALGGPDGGSPWPLDDHLFHADSLGVGCNVAFMVGHNTVRRNVMKLEDRDPTAEELEGMKTQIRQGMEAGAFGISTGLKYLPGAFSKVDEVIELSKVASEYGGFYTSHLREEGIGLLEAVYEAISIGREASIPIVLTHHKAIGTTMWGASVKTLAMVDSARNIGLDIMMDQYPYNASYTSISVLIPSWARAGGKFEERVNNPVLKDSIKRGIIHNILYDRGGADLHRVQFARVTWNQQLEGKTLHDWLVMQDLEPSIENGAEAVIQAQLNGGASCVYFAMDDEDVERIMAHPQTMIASDGRLVQPGEGHPHPRWYGTFPRVLGVYVREKGIISLSEAIRKMTSMPADRMGLTDRGRIQIGNMADIVIFNPETVKDMATFDNPHQYPVGIDYVLVNGVLAVEKGEYKDVRSGKVLRKERSVEVGSDK